MSDHLKITYDPRVPPDAPLFLMNEERMNAIRGKALAEQGMAQAGSGHPVGVLVSWLSRARIGILWLCEADASFGADDLRRIVGDPPVANVMGAVFRSAAKDGLIVQDGVDLARRPSRHASITRLWRRA